MFAIVAAVPCLLLLPLQPSRVFACTPVCAIFCCGVCVGTGERTIPFFPSLLGTFSIPRAYVLQLIIFDPPPHYRIFTQAAVAQFKSLLAEANLQHNTSYDVFLSLHSEDVRFAAVEESERLKLFQEHLAPLRREEAKRPRPPSSKPLSYYLLPPLLAFRSFLTSVAVWAVV